MREALAAAEEECDHLAQLAEDLLVLARSGDGPLPVRPSELATGELLEAVIERVADRARTRGRGIRMENADGLRLEADELRLRHALGNLVDVRDETVAPRGGVMAIRNWSPSHQIQTPMSRRPARSRRWRRTRPEASLRTCP